jgi:hypothetical protein
MKDTVRLSYPNVPESVDLQLRVESVQFIEHDSQFFMVDLE